MNSPMNGATPLQQLPILLAYDEQLVEVELLLAGQGGEVTSIQAGAGILDRGVGRFDMQGGIAVVADPGYRLTTASASGLLDSTLIEMPAAVSGQAPAGEISAGRMELRADSSNPPRYRLVFSGGVRFNYLPEP